jgi:hypothetical protein
MNPLNSPVLAETQAGVRGGRAGVCRACFSTDASLAKHSDFVKEYKEQFAAQLDPESAQFPASLAKATARLKEWRTRLQSNVEDRGPAVLALEDESRMLRDFRPLVRASASSPACVPPLNESDA